MLTFSIYDPGICGSCCDELVKCTFPPFYKFSTQYIEITHALCFVNFSRRVVIKRNTTRTINFLSCPIFLYSFNCLTCWLVEIVHSKNMLNVLSLTELRGQNHFKIRGHFPRQNVWFNSLKTNAIGFSPKVNPKIILITYQYITSYPNIV